MDNECTASLVVPASLPGYGISFLGLLLFLTMGVLRRRFIAKVGEPVIEIDASVKDL